MNEIAIRSTGLDDVQAVAEFHVRSWRHTYRNLAPPHAYAILDVPYRRKMWTRKLSADDRTLIVLVAETAGRIVGMGAAGGSSKPEYGGRGAIRSLYVDSDFKRRGIGRLLLSRLAIHLTNAKYRGAALSVVRENAPAIAFYRSLNGRQIGEYVDSGPVWQSHNLVFAWDDLASLVG
ncbi:acetyltransferase GCN5 [Burkholderia aenigmatica]|uniref:Acetyltransferase GCN5 n=1 Tax=Burkholderia aenigmatica TaxID=2015348 RepID=A0A6P2PV10_9BURK|nr:MULTISPECIES: GNAT family N-acetyltransferase [Burkholderia]VWC11269.1 acetyltransferase GCN5 [Burkholderia aenigmatica]